MQLISVVSADHLEDVFHGWPEQTIQTRACHVLLCGPGPPLLCLVPQLHILSRHLLVAWPEMAKYNELQCKMCTCSLDGDLANGAQEYCTKVLSLPISRRAKRRSDEVQTRPLRRSNTPYRNIKELKRYLTLTVQPLARRHIKTMELFRTTPIPKVPRWHWQRSAKTKDYRKQDHERSHRIQRYCAFLQGTSMEDRSGPFAIIGFSVGIVATGRLEAHGKVP